MRRSLLAALLVIGVALAVAVFFLVRPDSCDGLPRSIGACDSDRPQFTGGDCDGVAREWGTQLDERIIQVVEGPETVGDQARSSRLYDVETLVSQLANQYMRENGMTSECNPQRFLAAGEARLSPEAKDGVRDVMYDGDPAVEYDEWRDRLATWVDLILALE